MEVISIQTTTNIVGIYLYFLPRLLVFSSHILAHDVFLRVCFVLFRETGSFCVAQAPASKCRDYGHEPSHPAKAVCLVLVLGLNEALMCSLYARHTFYLQASSLACWSPVVPDQLHRMDITSRGWPVGHWCVGLSPDSHFSCIVHMSWLSQLWCRFWNKEI